ncbi:unnamed protein product, partial [Ectocarpus sp. 4 AP-2014]
MVYPARRANGGLAYVGATANPSTDLFTLGSTFTVQTSWGADSIVVHPNA